MAAHAPGTKNRPLRRTALATLDWTHYWLLAGVLGGMLALVLMVFAIAIATR